MRIKVCIVAQSIVLNCNSERFYHIHIIDLYDVGCL